MDIRDFCKNEQEPQVDFLFPAGWYSECLVNDEHALWLESTNEDWNPEESDTVASKIKWYSEEEINKQDCTIVI